MQQRTDQTIEKNIEYTLEYNIEWDIENNIKQTIIQNIQYHINKYSKNKIQIRIKQECELLIYKFLQLIKLLIRNKIRRSSKKSIYDRQLDNETKKGDKCSKLKYIEA